MDKRKFKELQTEQRDAAVVEVTARTKPADFQKKVEMQREKISKVRAAVRDADFADPKNFTDFQVGNITVQDREKFILERRVLVEQLQAEEPRLAPMVAMVANLEREHAAALESLNGKMHALWYFIRESRVEELRIASRLKMVEVCVLLARSGAQYVWPTTDSVFGRVYGFQILPEERRAIEEALDREFL